MLDIRFVYFDLDDTLLDHRTAERAALADLHDELAELAGVPMDLYRDTYHRINIGVWKEYSAGKLTKQETRWVRFDRMLTALSLQGPDPVAMGERYLERYSEHWCYLPGALEAFNRVALSRPVGLVTNGFAEIQRAKLDRFPELSQRSAAVIISEEVGYMKPDRRLFELAADLAETDPRHILYVGDSLHSDVHGGLAAGWRVAWFSGDEGSAPADVFVFDDWNQLTAALEDRAPEGPAS